MLIELATIHWFENVTLKYVILRNYFFSRKILENSSVEETNESLKQAFDRIVALPLRSAMSVHKSAKELSPKDSNTPRQEATLTSYEKYLMKVLFLNKK